MIEVISYELADKLYNLGFNESCRAYYNELNGGEITLNNTTRDIQYYTDNVFYRIAPTKIQAKEWFEKHNIELDDELK
jgi:hypothetical protein